MERSSYLADDAAHIERTPEIKNLPRVYTIVKADSQDQVQQGDLRAVPFKRSLQFTRIKTSNRTSEPVTCL